MPFRPIVQLVQCAAEKVILAWACLNFVAFSVYAAPEQPTSEFTKLFKRVDVTLSRKGVDLEGRKIIR